MIIHVKYRYTDLLILKFNNYGIVYIYLRLCDNYGGFHRDAGYDTSF